MGGCAERGVLLAGLSSLFFSLCSLVAKSLGEELHPFQLSCLSFLGIVSVSGLVALRLGGGGPLLFPPECRKSLLSRSLAGTLFLISSFYSVQLIPLGDASVLFYMAPAFTVLLAKPLLKEPTSSRNLVLAFILMICVILVMKPPFIFSSTDMSPEYLLGVAMAVTASFTDAIGNIALRDLRTVHYSVVMFNYGLMSFLQTSFISLFFTKWISLSNNQLALLILLVLLNTVEQIFMTLALKFEKAGLVSLVQASDIIYGYAFQIIFFDETIDVISIIGAICIAVIIFVISLDSKRNTNDSIILKY